MATNFYIAKFRKLKKVYCESYGKNISDVTWYRISSQMRRFLHIDFKDPAAESMVKTIGHLKRCHRNFRMSGDVFAEAMSLFVHYKEMNKTMTCAEFLCDLAEKIDISKVSRTSRYVWFASSGIPFRLESKYHTDDFAIVAFRAGKSIHHKHTYAGKKASDIMNMKKADPCDLVAE